MKKQDKKKNEVAVKVEGVSKSFKVPHDKKNSLKGTAISLFNSKNRGYEIFNALDGIGFEVKKGEFFGIIGKNGSGKSTLLKILAGIYTTNSGLISINGKLSPFLELGVGFNPELTARENVFLGGAILGLTRKEIFEKFDAIIQFAELEEFVDMKFKNFSSGMQVRLAFALAVNARAEILLMDEVLAVGDTNFQAKCIDVFTNYRKQGKTVILVTHDTGIVERYCDRAMLLRSGKVVEIGDPGKVAEKYFDQNIGDIEAKEGFGVERKGDHGGRPFIKSVDFYDIKGKQTNIFKTGDSVEVRVTFENPAKMSNLNFGLALLTDTDEYLFGINTIDDKISTEKYIKDGFFSVRYKNIPLRTNTLKIKTGIWGETVARQYDYYEGPERISVRSNDKKQGLVSLDHEWK